MQNLSQKELNDLGTALENVLKKMNEIEALKKEGKTMAYIISRDGEKILHAVHTDLKNGTRVEYCYERTIDGSFVNCFKGKISRAKKWDRLIMRDGLHIELNKVFFRETI